MSEQPKIDDPANLRDLLDKFADLQAEADAEAEAEANDAAAASDVEPGPGPSKKKKKKSKNKASKAIQKLKDISSGNVPAELVTQVQQQIVNDTPLGAAPPSINEAEIKRALQAVDLIKLLEGKSALGNAQNTKDLGEHKFWKTQPVIQTVSTASSTSEPTEGPIDPPRTVDSVRTDPLALPSGYEWSTIDITSPTQLRETQQLLSENYVEDPDASFRLGYTDEFLRWALGPPGYEEEWHVGVRVKGSGKLVAFISGIPMTVGVRDR